LITFIKYIAFTPFLVESIFVPCKDQDWFAYLAKWKKKKKKERKKLNFGSGKCFDKGKKNRNTDAAQWNGSSSVWG